MSNAPHVLVIRRRYLGDIVLLGSFIKNIKLSWPNAQIRVLVQASFSSLLELNPDVTEAIKMPQKKSAWPKFLLRIRSYGFTHVFNFDNTEGTALIARISGAPFRCGSHHGGYTLKLKAFYTHVSHDLNEVHESRPFTEYYLLALEQASIPILTRSITLTPKQEDVSDLQRFVGACNQVVLIHPGSRSAYRVWPVERFALICDRIQEELGAQVILVGGPNDDAVITAICSKTKTHLLKINESLTVQRFAALVKLAQVALCHDSGPMHVAAAVGTKVVALYGSQNAVLFQPMGEGHILLQAPLPCANCIAPDRCTVNDSYHNLCVQNISADDVFKAIKNQLLKISLTSV